MSELLWQPAEERIKNTNMYHFMEYVNTRRGMNLANYDELYGWSIEESPVFWETLWAYSEVIHSRSYDQVVDDIKKMPGARWFEGARFNFAENLLQYQDDHIALSFKGETRPTVSITYSELYQQVARLAKSLRDMGIQPGDRVAGFMPNMIETVVAMLAATSIGAIWSSCSPDFGIKGVLDRFGQIEPKIIFTANGYIYNSKRFDSLERISGILEHITSVQKVVVVTYTEENPDISSIPNAVLWNDFVSDEENLEIQSIWRSFTPICHPAQETLPIKEKDKENLTLKKGGGDGKNKFCC